MLTSYCESPIIVRCRVPRHQHSKEKQRAQGVMERTEKDTTFTASESTWYATCTVSESTWYTTLRTQTQAQVHKNENFLIPAAA